MAAANVKQARLRVWLLTDLRMISTSKAHQGGGLETKNAFWIIDASYIRKRVGETGGVVGVGNGMLIASPDGLHAGEG